jgi:hypothetical protein
MIPLGILNQVDGYTFMYSGQLHLGDKQYIVVAFETKHRNDSNSFEIKVVEHPGELQAVLKSFEVKVEESKPKKVVWDDTRIPVPAGEVPKKPNKSLSLF